MIYRYNNLFSVLQHHYLIFILSFPSFVPYFQFKHDIVFECKIIYKSPEGGQIVRIKVKAKKQLRLTAYKDR